MQQDRDKPASGAIAPTQASATNTTSTTVGKTTESDLSSALTGATGSQGSEVVQTGHGHVQRPVTGPKGFQPNLPDYKPYKATSLGLIKARQECRLEMVKIVNEVTRVQQPIWNALLTRMHRSIL